MLLFIVGLQVAHYWMPGAGQDEGRAKEFFQIWQSHEELFCEGSFSCWLYFPSAVIIQSCESCRSPWPEDVGLWHLTDFAKQPGRLLCYSKHEVKDKQQSTCPPATMCWTSDNGLESKAADPEWPVWIQERVFTGSSITGQRKPSKSYVLFKGFLKDIPFWTLRMDFAC